jgi:DNA-binding NtrC family response regulator
MKVAVEIPPDTTKNSPPLNVLIVDDEPLIRWSLAETLVQAGFHVCEAGSKKEALLQVRADPSPDAILLDYRLPDSNDLHLLESIRRVLPTSPVIMMTAFGTPEVLAGAAHLGAYRVLSKPVELSDLAAMVQQACDARFR